MRATWPANFAGSQRLVRALGWQSPHEHGHVEFSSAVPRCSLRLSPEERSGSFSGPFRRSRSCAWHSIYRPGTHSLVMPYFPPTEERSS